MRPGRGRAPGGASCPRRSASSRARAEMAESNLRTLLASVRGREAPRTRPVGDSEMEAILGRAQAGRRRASGRSGGRERSSDAADERRRLNRSPIGRRSRRRRGPARALRAQVLAAARLRCPARRLAGGDHRAARVEPAPVGDPGRVRRLALQDRPLDAPRLRDDVEQRLRVGVQGTQQHVLGGADLDDAAQVHDRDAVGDGPRQPQVVRHDDDRQAAGPRGAA